MWIDLKCDALVVHLWGPLVHLRCTFGACLGAGLLWSHVYLHSGKKNNCWLSFAGWNTAGNSSGIYGFSVISIKLGLKLTCLKLTCRKYASNLPVWSLHVCSLPVDSVQVTYLFETFLFEAYLSKYHKWVSLISAKSKHEHWRLRFHFSNKANMSSEDFTSDDCCRWINCTWLHLPRRFSRSSLLPVEGKIWLGNRYLLRYLFKE